MQRVHRGVQDGVFVLHGELFVLYGALFRKLQLVMRQRMFGL